MYECNCGKRFRSTDVADKACTHGCPACKETDSVTWVNTPAYRPQVRSAWAREYIRLADLFGFGQTAPAQADLQGDLDFMQS